MSPETADTAARLLDFEDRARRAGLTPGEKEERIIAELGLQPAHYYALLTRVIDTRPALEHNAILTRRLQRERSGNAVRGRARRVPLLAPDEDGGGDAA